MSSLPVFSEVRVTRTLILYVCFADRCLSFWPLCCLFFFDIRILIIPLVSSNSSSNYTNINSSNICLNLNRTQSTVIVSSSFFNFISDWGRGEYTTNHWKESAIYKYIFKYLYFSIKHIHRYREVYLYYIRSCKYFSDKPFVCN
jgi:hypothetical protein